MSKDDTCKVTSASKHKERKPKKPHYIPRPWGKPYNYKCFQCPFTCMEKSHLYNHMKYSLCKNSLSLLIESDWPYKKGNILHPEQLRPFQQAHGLHGAQPESELLMADMLSLEDQLLRARSVEVEAQLRHYKLSKTCLTAPGLLSEQWRLLASSHTKAKAEGAQPRVGGSIPCYPPPPNLVDYQDPTGLNLSVLGVGYPISPSLFSYMNSLAQLPFLASAAQLMHPASSTHSDRPLIPPRLYYPFLYEHAFGPASSQSDAGKSLKASTNSLETSPLSGFQPKVNLWKVPALRPGTTVSPAGWASPQEDSSEPGYRVGDSDPQQHSRSNEIWSNNPLASPKTETSSLSSYGGPNSQDSTGVRTTGEGASESVAALLSDLSKALQEYQEAERKISHLEKQDLPAQRHLWEHLNKIRSELSHIHQALERTARQSDGPLDLSVKRDATDSVSDQSAREEGSCKDTMTETEEEDEELDERKEEEDEDECERKVMKASLESRKQSLDMLIKMSQASVMSAEVLSPAGLGLRPSPAEALWPGRTTKCEADSSVLLCPDGRSVVFTDIPSSAKPPKRPPSIQRLETQCPPSPLTAADN
uniref:Si:ch211-248l17.3 n=1 Tax=Salarias fasciatus TaxID=181472 RepID=A0A672FH66_SALFA